MVRPGRGPEQQRRDPAHGGGEGGVSVRDGVTLQDLPLQLCHPTGVDLPAVTWDVEHGPWFDNGVMTVVVDGHRAHLEVDHYRVRHGRVLRRSRTAPLTPPVGMTHAIPARPGARGDRMITRGWGRGQREEPARRLL